MNIESEQNVGVNVVERLAVLIEEIVQRVEGFEWGSKGAEDGVGQKGESEFDGEFQFANAMNKTGVDKEALDGAKDFGDLEAAGDGENKLVVAAGDDRGAVSAESVHQAAQIVGRPIHDDCPPMSLGAQFLPFGEQGASQIRQIVDVHKIRRIPIEQGEVSIRRLLREILSTSR